MRGNTVRRTGPVSAAGDTVTSFAGDRTTQRYQATQWAAGRLPDVGFPGEEPGIAASQRWLVEPVTGRFSSGRVAGAGRLSDR
jgi:hypothetical protein